MSSRVAMIAVALAVAACACRSKPQVYEPHNGLALSVRGELCENTVAVGQRITTYAQTVAAVNGGGGPLFPMGLQRSSKSQRFVPTPGKVANG